MSPAKIVIVAAYQHALDSVQNRQSMFKLSQDSKKIFTANSVP